MEIAGSKSELSEYLASSRFSGRKIGFVPTMGALHDGHISLVRTARQHSDVTVVSIFVNPTQFGPNEDFQRYPRSPERDCQLLKEAGVHVAYLPRVADMYSEGESTTVDPGPVGNVFEGAFRPGHFRGVLTVVAKLFNQVKPGVAVFGAKDAQQLFLIRQMVRDLQFPIEIIESATVREPDGLAMSSRNTFLKSDERRKATLLWRALQAGKIKLDQGERSLGQVQMAMKSVLECESDFLLDYATAVSEESFRETELIVDPVRLIIAGRLGSVRLIDNVLWKSSEYLELQ